MSDIEPFSANSTTLVSGLADKLNETIEVVNDLDSNTSISISNLQEELNGISDFSDVEITGGIITNTNITAFGTNESGNGSPLTITNNSDSATFGLDNSGALLINNNNDSLRIGDNNVFHEGNDGSGSGLDADLLDGQQGSYYTDIIARLGYTPLNTAGGTITGQTTFNSVVNFNNNLNIPGARIFGGFGSITTGGILDWNHETNTRVGSGQTLLRGRTAENAPPGVDSQFFHPFTFGYTANNINRTQFAIPYGNNTNNMFMRGEFNGVWGDWTKFWTDKNDGSGSGLDADLLDGQQGSYYTNITARLGYTPLNTAGGTLTGGIGFADIISTSPTNLSNHLDLFRGAYGFSITPSTLNYISGGVHDFYSNTTLRARITASTADFFVVRLNARNSTNGYITLVSSSPNNTGHIEFNESDETRAGFIGFGASGGPIIIQAENASHYQFNRTPRVVNEDIVHGGNFYDFAGRYESRITHISTSTIDLNDVGGIIEVTNTNAIIPNDSTVNFPVGTKLDFLNLGTGVSGIQPATGVFLRSADNNRTFRVRYSAATAYKRGANDWVLIGDLV